MARILAVDYGSKRIGLAISDEMKIISRALPAIQAKNPAEIQGQLKQIVEGENVEKILVGLPLNLQGKDSAQTKTVREFAQSLKKFALVEFIDERFTTKEILKELKTRGQSQKKYRNEIDSMVAQKLLERYLEINGKIRSV